MIPLLALCLGYFMTILDVTIVNVALVNIKEHLSSNVTGLQWIVDGYALVFASFLLTGGALGERRGSRTIFLVGFALFTKIAPGCPCPCKQGRNGAFLIRWLEWGGQHIALRSCSYSHRSDELGYRTDG
jgi:MFS family permease